MPHQFVVRVVYYCVSGPAAGWWANWFGNEQVLQLRYDIVVQSIRKKIYKIKTWQKIKGFSNLDRFK